MTVSLDTAQAEVLQRSREDRGMKLIKLQIEPATDTRTLRIVGNGGRQERELGLREGESMSDGENRVTEMAEQTALKVGGLYKVTNPTSEHFGKVGVLRSVVSYADGLEIPSPKRPLWIEFTVWSGLHHCHTQVDFARDDVAPYESEDTLLRRLKVWIATRARDLAFRLDGCP